MRTAVRTPISPAPDEVEDAAHAEAWDTAYDGSRNPVCDLGARLTRVEDAQPSSGGAPMLQPNQLPLMQSPRIQAHPRMGSRAQQGGFTFIEILIVMGIIGVLVGGVSMAISIWSRKGPEFVTKNNVAAVDGLAKAWRSQFEVYPPGDVKDLPRYTALHSVKVKGGTNKVNMGIESVYQAFYWPGFKSEHNWGENQIGNIDEDELDKPIGTNGSAALREILDAWGNPLIYFHHLEYAKKADSGATIRLSDDSEVGVPGDELDAYPHKNEDGQFFNANTFQVFSCGPDGEPNTEDDIGNW